VSRRRSRSSKGAKRRRQSLETKLLWLRLRPKKPLKLNKRPPLLRRKSPKKRRSLSRRRSTRPTKTRWQSRLR